MNKSVATFKANVPREVAISAKGSFVAAKRDIFCTEDFDLYVWDIKKKNQIIFRIGLNMAFSPSNDNFLVICSKILEIIDLRNETSF